MINKQLLAVFAGIFVGIFGTIFFGSLVSHEALGKVWYGVGIGFGAGLGAVLAILIWNRLVGYFDRLASKGA